MSNPTKNPSWSYLSAHAKAMADTHMRDLFAEDSLRYERFTLEAAGVFVDFSKNRIVGETVDKLVSLAEEQGLAGKIDALFSGKPINNTERRAASHVALRYRGEMPMLVEGGDVMPKVRSVLDQMGNFAEGVRSGKIKGATEQRFKHIVNIGIGGSDLGPRMVAEALQEYSDGTINIHFASNVDPNDILGVLKRCDAEMTLFVVTSKSFMTEETLANARIARDWLVARLGEEAVSRHFAAVSAHPERAKHFGIVEELVFDFWDWVGGRYSLWSAVGLPIALFLGMSVTEELLQGAYEMDNHFRYTPFERNIPVILAMLGIWNCNFLDSPTHAILPYDERLKEFVTYVQQLDMESNGKTVSRDGATINYGTGPVVWGGVGTNAQHAFFQLLHQGGHPVSSDFIAVRRPCHGYIENHHLLLANFVAQAEALMRGQTKESAAAELARLGLSSEEIKRLSPHKHFVGNRPSNSILLDKLAPSTLGAMIAMYEHKVFVQGVIWNVNSFDQWGVELGKQLAKVVISDLATGENIADHDCSTAGLIRRLQG